MLDSQTVVIILIAIIQVILILSVVHISSKTNEMCDRLAEIAQLLRKGTPSNTSNSSDIKPLNKPVGNTWTCHDCGTVNSTSSRICKGCGKDK